MTDKPATTYVVSRLREAALADRADHEGQDEGAGDGKEIGDKVRVEEITPKVKRR